MIYRASPWRDAMVRNHEFHEISSTSGRVGAISMLILPFVLNESINANAILAIHGRQIMVFDLRNLIKQCLPCDRSHISVIVSECERRQRFVNVLLGTHWVARVTSRSLHEQLPRLADSVGIVLEHAREKLVGTLLDSMGWRDRWPVCVAHQCSQTIDTHLGAWWMGIVPHKFAVLFGDTIHMSTQHVSLTENGRRERSRVHYCSLSALFEFSVVQVQSG